MSAEPPFLKLPGELRNTIYEFVLSSPTPLILDKPRALRHSKPYKEHDPDAHTSNSEASHVEFNKLKYVNKQLYSETADLEFKYNDIKIEWSLLRTGSSSQGSERELIHRYILCKKGDLINIGDGAVSQGERPKIFWQYAKDLWEVRCGTYS